MTQISHKLRALAVQLALTRAQKNHVDKLGALAAEVETLERALQQRRAQDRSMGDSSGKISDNDGHSLRKREESIRGEPPAQSSEIRKLVEEQANDEGLWFQARTAPEAYLQQQLRLLHEVIERATK